jgi:hypothetical protein
MTSRNLLYLTLMFYLSACTSDKDINGNWVSKGGIFPTLIIKGDSIIISDDYLGVRQSKYILENDKIILLDSTKILGKRAFNMFRLKKHYGDSLIVTSGDSNYEQVLVQREMKSTRFDRIRLEYQNGWNYGSITEIDSIGYAKVWEENSDDHVRNYGTELFRSETLEQLTPFANYLYLNDTLKLDFSSCSDCESYLLSLQKDDTIKVFAFKGRINSVLPLITTPILNFAKNVKKYKIDIYGRLPFHESLGESKTVIARIK